MKRLFLLFLLISFGNSQIIAPNGSYVFLEQYFTSPNITNFTVPANVYSFVALLIGGGGSGGGAETTVASGGGGGGGTLQASVTVTPGTLCEIQVGQGGNSVNATIGENGGNSTISCPNLFLQANGGEGGQIDVFSFPASGGYGIINGSGVLYSNLVQGQDGAGVVGGSSSEGGGATFPGTLALPLGSGGTFGGGGAGSLNIYQFIPSTPGGNGIVKISYIQQILS